MQVVQGAVCMQTNSSVERTVSCSVPCSIMKGVITVMPDCRNALGVLVSSSKRGIMIH